MTPETNTVDVLGGNPLKRIPEALDSDSQSRSNPMVRDALIYVVRERSQIV